MDTFSSNMIDDLLDSIDPIEQAKTDARMLIAAKIADAMKEKGWKNKDLLKALKKENPSIITKWLSGTHNFTSDTLVEIGCALGIDLLNLSEPAQSVVVYHQSVSQKAQTSSPDTYLFNLLRQLEKQDLEYPAGSYHFSSKSNNQFAQA